MKTLKGYELLEKIANGEIKNGANIKRNKTNELYTYENEVLYGKNNDYCISISFPFEEDFIIVEENKEIEELDLEKIQHTSEYITEEILVNKINELVIEINKLKKGEK